MHPPPKLESRGGAVTSSREGMNLSPEEMHGACHNWLHWFNDSQPFFCVCVCLCMSIIHTAGGHSRGAWWTDCFCSFMVLANCTQKLVTTRRLCYRSKSFCGFSGECWQSLIIPHFLQQMTHDRNHTTQGWSHISLNLWPCPYVLTGLIAPNSCLPWLRKIKQNKHIQRHMRLNLNHFKSATREGRIYPTSAMCVRPEPMCCVLRS